jgi:hypothetical protein
MKRTSQRAACAALALGAVLFQGCPSAVSDVAASFLGDCFSENSISAAEFEDLNVIEQALYDQNNCGRYEPRSDFFDLFL